MIMFRLMVISLLFPALSLADGDVPSKSTSTDADRLSVRYHDPLLWVEIREATLSEVAKALAEQTGLKIEIEEYLACDTGNNMSSTKERMRS